MSRAIFFCTVCLILTAFAPTNNICAVAVEPPATAELESFSDTRIGESAVKYAAEGERLPEKKSAAEEAGGEKPDKKPVRVPLPSSVWLMAGGLLALVLIRRNNKK